MTLIFCCSLFSKYLNILLSYTELTGLRFAKFFGKERPLDKTDINLKCDLKRRVGILNT